MFAQRISFDAHKIYTVKNSVQKVRYMVLLVVYFFKVKFRPTEGIRKDTLNPPILASDTLHNVLR